MLIRYLMTSPVFTCKQDDTLDTVAQIMWEHDCGVVPVTDRERRVVGMITDRDVCMATHLQGKAPAAIRVEDAMQRRVHSIQGDDMVEALEQLMTDHQVRRAPVVDREGRLEGIISLADVVRATLHEFLRSDAFDAGIVRTIAAVCRPRSVTPAVSGQERAA